MTERQCKQCIYLADVERNGCRLCRKLNDYVFPASLACKYVEDSDVF